MRKRKAFNLFTKIRAALRLIFRNSPRYREALDSIEWIKRMDGSIEFLCKPCGKFRAKETARVDHQPPCGALTAWEELEPFARQLFEGPTRVICRPCHDKVTKEQRKKRR